MNEVNSIRLNKYIAMAGICGRREADELIVKGAVRINGNVISKLGTIVNNDDKVEVNGKEIHLVKNKIYIVLNKPKGIVCTSNDELGRKTVIDIVNSKERLFTIGRLDKDSEGLIILTNDGDFSQKLSHPSNVVEKEYQLTLLGGDDTVEKVVEKFISGLKIDKHLMKVRKVELINANQNNYTFKIVLHQGYNRQLRKMSEALQLKVVSLLRVRIGKLKIKNLKSGNYCSFDPKEV